MVDDEYSVSYTYNSDGIRIGKNSNGEVHEYILDGTNIIADKWTSDDVSYIIVYLYDELGAPIGFKYRTGSYAEGVYDCYYYEKNLQGDVIGIYNASGTKICTYVYDAWGYCTTTVTSGVTSTERQIANRLSLFRYRGYVYDADTGLYYVSSRYYNPIFGRWINADNAISGTGESVQGYNLFAYCFNNPVNMDDQNGHWPSWLTKLVVAVAVVAVVAVVATVCVATCGAGSVIAAAAVGAAKGAAIGLAAGAASGAAIGYATTGTLEGTLDGMADGALSGAISGAISGGISGGAKAISQSSSRVLWSGGDTAKNTAASYAKSIGGITLEQTPKGKLLTGLTNIFGYDKTASLWQKASVEFAGSARGNVTAIVSRAGYRGAGSILSQFEYPMVASRIIDGLVDSFNVILIG